MFPERVTIAADRNDQGRDPTKEAPITSKTLTINQAADRLGVHYMTVYKYIRTGRLPAVKIEGEWQIEAADLDAMTQRSPAPRGRGRRIDDYPARLEAQLVAGDETGAWSIVQSALASGMEPDQVYLELFAPAMRGIGDRWELDELSVGEEHTASAVMVRLIGRMGPSMRRRGRRRGLIVVGAPPQDDHGIPISLVADLLRHRGFEVRDLGANVPASSFGEMVRAQRRLIGVGIGATTLGNERNIRQAATAIHRSTDAPLVVGGSAITSLDQARGLGADAWSRTALVAVSTFEQLA